MKVLDLFSGEESELGEPPKLNALPVSVIDIGAQKKRKAGNHDKQSSRSGFSPFPDEIVDLCYGLYLSKAKHVFDPFAGWGERHRGAVDYGVKYTGYDTSKDAIKSAFDIYGVKNYMADSEKTLPPDNYDGLITCPPYWNLERYAGEGIDGHKTWPEFLHSLNQIFSLAYLNSAKGAVFCVMSGDWRKNHVYYDLTHQIDSMFAGYGATVIDKVTVSRKAVSKIKLMIPQAVKLGYSVRVHESLHVYKKEKK